MGCLFSYPLTGPPRSKLAHFTVFLSITEQTMRFQTYPTGSLKGNQRLENKNSTTNLHPAPLPTRLWECIE
jgi:hypothetical protein